MFVRVSWYYLDMTSIVGKKQDGKTYYYAVESARVDGKPRIVSQQYLGSADEVMAKISGAGAGGVPVRSAHHRFGDVAAVWGVLERLGVAQIIDDVVAGAAPVKGMSVGRFLVVAALNRVCLLYTSPSPRDRQKSRMPSSA